MATELKLFHKLLHCRCLGFNQRRIGPLILQLIRVNKKNNVYNLK